MARPATLEDKTGLTFGDVAERSMRQTQNLVYSARVLKVQILPSPLFGSQRGEIADAPALGAGSDQECGCNSHRWHQIVLKEPTFI